MRTLWHSTASLLRKYPILWLPVVLADLTAFCLRLLQVWMKNAVIQSLVAGHSVLSDTPEPLRTLPAAWAAVFGASKLVVELVNVCLYAAAMIAISMLIPTLIAQTEMPWRQILFALKQLRVRILLFSLTILAMIAVAVFLDIQLITYMPRLSTFNASSRGQNLAMIALLFAAAAWLIAPTAVALLRPRESPANDSRQRRYARNFAAISVLASVAIYFVATVAEPSFAPLSTTALGVNLFWGVGSVLSALPYIPLFIALYLVANAESPLTPTPDSPAPLPSPPQSPPASISA